MKKIIPLFFAALLFSVVSNAQNFQIGLKAGANFSNFSGASSANDIKENSMVGFHAGGLLNLKFGSFFSLQPELLISSAGAKLEQAGQKENFRATYATLPVMAKLNFGAVYIEGGPQFGLKVSDKVSGINTDVKSLDVALAAGLGVHTRSGFGVGARYIAGLSKVGDIDFGGAVNPDYKHSVIQVSLFYTIFNNN